MNDATKKWIRTALVAYAVSAVFAVCFVTAYISTHMVHDNLGWEALAPPVLLTIAGLAAVPIAVPFIWERLTKVKVLGLELDLTSLTEVKADVSTALPEVLEDTQRLQLGNSMLDEISRQIKAAIRDAETAQLLEIDLQRGKYWWSTRLYLLAALAQDYTQIRQLIFLADCEGRKRCFIGMATPAATRRALATRHPILETAYRQCRAQHWEHLPLSHKGFVVPDEEPVAHANEVEMVVQEFGLTLRLTHHVDEAQAKVWIDAQLLREWLDPDLNTYSVESPGDRVTSSLLVQIVSCVNRFVAVVRNRQLLQVVDRLKLAAHIAGQVLPQQTARQ